MTIDIDMYNIYKITNTINDKFYIGVTKSKYRFSQHMSSAFRGEKNTPLYNSIRKYGRDNFKYEILESGNDYEYGWQVREPYYIKKLKPQYNLTSGGDGIRDFTMPRDIVEQIAKKNTGKKRTMETRQRISQALTGMTLPEEVKKKMSISALKSKNIKQRANHLNKKLKCKMCGLETNIGNIKRYGHVV
jgi:group I intron endonuclease